MMCLSYINYAKLVKFSQPAKNGRTMPPTDMVQYVETPKLLQVQPEPRKAGKIANESANIKKSEYLHKL